MIRSNQSLLCCTLFLTFMVTSSSATESLNDTMLPTTTRFWSFGEGSCAGGSEYMCLDWSFGSGRMVQAQQSYGGNVYFAVGSYGSQKNIGKCYEFTTDAVPTKFIAQAINEGSDVNHGQFDIQMAAGGFGIFNACTKKNFWTHMTESGSYPMFNQPPSSFGFRFGGQVNPTACAYVPKNPFNDWRPRGEPSVRALCYRAFRWGARRPKRVGNPKIKSIKRVRCPKQLYEITGLRLRSDDHRFHNEHMWNYGYLTSTFDCCKPSGCWPKRSDGSWKYHADSRYPNVRACLRDGYTRVSHE